MLPPLDSWEKLERKTLIAGYQARFIHSATMTFMLVDAAAGAPVPEHHHPHEQVTHLLDGEFELTVGGILHKMKPGDVAVIPSNTPHSALAITDCEIMDVFTPRREDYVSGDFAVVSGR